MMITCKHLQELYIYIPIEATHDQLCIRPNSTSSQYNNIISVYTCNEAGSNQDGSGTIQARPRKKINNILRNLRAGEQDNYYNTL